MRNSILVLEESSMVHELFKSALPTDFRDWQIEHELETDQYVAKARKTQPTIILLSNQDQENDYEIAKKIRSYPALDETPILLLTKAKDRLQERKLQEIGIQGFIRKPFESTTLKKQIKAALKNFRAENFNSELEDLDIVDDELLGLLSGKTPREIALGSLEEELDPSLQLHPIEAGSILEEDQDSEDIDSYDVEEEDFIEEEDILESDDIDESEDLEPEYLEEDSGYLDDEEGASLEAETEAMEIELEEISLDFDEIETDEDDYGLEDVEVEAFSHSIIRVIPSNRPAPANLVKNVSENNFIGFMDIEIIFHDSVMKIESDADESDDDLDISFEDMDEDDAHNIPEDEDLYLEIEDELDDEELEDEVEECIDEVHSSAGYTELDITFESPDSASISTPGIQNSSHDVAYTDLEVYLEDDDLIEIEHTEISDDITGIDEPDLVDDIDESELTEILVEGIDDFDQDDRNFDEGEDVSGSFEVDDPEEDGQFLEVDFESDDESDNDAIDEDLDEEISDIFSLDDMDSTESSGPLDIQEMINLRQVRKAKYDIPSNESLADDVSGFGENGSLMSEEAEEVVEDDLMLDESDDEFIEAMADLPDDLDISDDTSIEPPDDDDFAMLEEDDEIEFSPMEEEGLFEDEVATAELEEFDPDEPEIDPFADSEESDDMLLLPEEENEDGDLTEELLIDDYSENEPLEAFTSESEIEGDSEEEEISLFAEPDDSEGIAFNEVTADDEELDTSDLDIDFSDPADDGDEDLLDFDQTDIKTMESLPEIEADESDPFDGSMTEYQDTEEYNESDLEEAEIADLDADEMDPFEDTDPLETGTAEETELFEVDESFSELEEVEIDPFEESDDLVVDVDEEAVDIFDDDPKVEEDVLELETDLTDPFEDTEDDLSLEIEEDDTDIFDDEGELETEITDLDTDDSDPFSGPEDLALAAEEEEQLNVEDDFYDLEETNSEVDEEIELDVADLSEQAESNTLLEEAPLEDPVEPIEDDIFGEMNEDDRAISESEASEDDTGEEIDLLSDNLPDIDEDAISDAFSDDESLTDDTDFENPDAELTEMVSAEIDSIDESDIATGDKSFDDAKDDQHENLLEETDENVALEVGTAEDEPAETADEMMTSFESGADLEMDDVIIEVPPDVFEIGDLKMESVTEDTGVHQDVESVNQDESMTEDISLPSMDEDLPDLNEMVIEEDDLFQDTSLDEDGILEETVTADVESSSQFQTEKSLLNNPEELRAKLSAMIEGVLADTIQTTLHDMLPEMMEKIIQEELD